MSNNLINLINFSGLIMKGNKVNKVIVPLW
jgi:hypothetical protein